MANNYQEYTTKIFLNDEQARSSIENLRKNIEQYKRDKAAALALGGKEGDKAWKEADRNIRQAEQQLKKLSTTSQQVNHVLGNLSTASVKELKQTIQAISRELERGAIQRGTTEWEVLTDQLRRAKEELKGIQSESEAASKGSFLSRASDFFNKNFGALSSAVGVYHTLASSVGGIVQKYVDLEETMANVTKYTGQTADEVRDMQTELQALDTRTPIEQLNGLAGAAGRLGFSAKDEILEFVDAADKIGVALGDDLGDGAVDQIGKLAKAFGEDETKGLRGAMLATGSAVNELSANGATEAGYLVDFTARLAGVGKQAGLTQTQIMGLGAVMDENMQRDETATTALSQLISKMATDTATFAQAAGVPLEQFRKLVEEDMNGALLTLFENLHKKGNFSDLAPVFADMGMKGTQASQIFSVLADKIELVKEKQLLAKGAYEDSTSIINEFNVQNNTLQANIDKVKKQADTLAQQLGAALYPAVGGVLNVAQALIPVLSTLLGFLVRHLTAVIPLAAAIASYKLQVQLATVASKVHAAILVTENVAGKAWAVTLAVMKGRVSALTVAQRALNLVMRANPLGVIITLTSAAVVGVKALCDKYGDITWRAKQFNKETKEQNERYEEQKQKIPDLLKKAQDVNTSMDDRREAIARLKKIAPDYFKDLDTEAKKLYNVADAQEEVSRRQREALKRKAVATITEYNQGAREYAGKYGQSHRSVVQNRNWNSSVNGPDVARMVQAEDKKELDEKRLAALEAAKALRELREEEEKRRKPAKAPETPETPETPTVPSTSGKSAASKRMSEELADVKKHYEQLLMAETNRYDQGLTNLEQYTAKEKELRLASMDEQLRIMQQYGQQDTDEYAQLLLEREAQETKSDNKLRDISLEQLEQRHQAEQALLKAQLYDEKSSIYGNEEALNTALLRSDIEYLRTKQSHYKATSDEWAQIESSIQQRLDDDKLEKARQYEQRKQQLMQDYLTQDYSRLEQQELDLLNEINAEKLLTEEQYQQMRMAIRAKYAGLKPSASDQASQQTSSALATAEKQAGTAPKADTSGADMGVTAFAGISKIVSYRKAVNEQLAQLYSEDAITQQQYDEAKKQNNQAMLSEVVSATQAAYSGISQIMSAASAYSQACSDYETAKITADYDKQIEAAGNNSKRKEKLEKERDKKIAKAKSEANKKAMAIEVAQAVASTAMAAINAYASASKVSFVLGPIAAAAATAAGLLQIATIKKQHQAEEAGYYEGGFTGGTHYRRQAGVVHESEFVANHQAVANSSILPVLQLIDQAQKSNTVASLTAADVSQALGVGSAPAVVAPVVNVQADTLGQEQMSRTLDSLSQTVALLREQLAGGITAIASIDGQNGVAEQLKRYNKLNSKAR